MKKVLVLTTTSNAHAPECLRDSAKRLELNIDVVEYAELTYLFEENNFTVAHQDRDFDLLAYDYYIFRSTGSYHCRLRGILADELISKNKIVLNGRYFSRFSGEANKLEQHYQFAKHGIACLPTKVIGSIDQFPHKLPSFPYIAKLVTGSYGRSVYKVDSNRTQRVVFTKNSPDDVLIQPFVLGGVDYRIIVLGGEILGCMKRVAKGGHFITNFVSGGKISNTEVNEEINELAKKAAKAFDLDYVGVDIAEHNGNPFVYEVNTAAEFKGFNQVMGIDVSEQILKFMIDLTKN